MAKEKKIDEPTAKLEKKTAKKEIFFTGTGRRKSAIASVFLYTKKGEFTINDKPMSDYFPNEREKLVWLRPFHLVGVSHPEGSYSGTIKVKGSGKLSQIDAVSLAFARALLAVNPEWRSVLRKAGALTRDSREVERKKYFLRKARKKPQYSKR